MLFLHKDDTELKDHPEDEIIMLYNNYFDHEVVRQIRHGMNNQYLFESTEEVMEYLQMMIRRVMEAREKKTSEIRMKLENKNLLKIILIFGCV